jgi:hypothetical protein
MLDVVQEYLVVQVVGCELVSPADTLLRAEKQGKSSKKAARLLQDGAGKLDSAATYTNFPYAG